jgi:hypothetical protein
VPKWPIEQEEEGAEKIAPFSQVTLWFFPIKKKVRGRYANPSSSEGDKPKRWQTFEMLTFKKMFFKKNLTRPIQLKEEGQTVSFVVGEKMNIRLHAKYQSVFLSPWKNHLSGNDISSKRRMVETVGFRTNNAGQPERKNNVL